VPPGNPSFGGEAWTDGIFIGGGGEDHGTPQHLLLKYANRHGLIAGATGTGKTVTLQILAEGFSAAGVPVFLSDVKGDLAGLAQAGSETGKLHERLHARAHHRLHRFRLCRLSGHLLGSFGQKGHPVRTTVSEMGPLLLSRLLELTEAQEGVLNIAFRVADEEGMALLDLKDLQALLTFVGRRGPIWACATAISRRPPSGRSSGGFWCSRGRAATGSSGNRRSIFPICS
jgi:uncharacterized protein